MKAAPADGRSFPWVMGALLALAVLPIWTVRHLPMVDLPHHLALVNVLHHLDDPALPYGRFFATRPGFVPYLGYYWSIHLAAFALPIESASRIFLTLYVAGLPAAACALADALGRSRWLALFSIPLVFSYEFYFGFINYLASLAMMTGALALYASRLRGRARGPGWDALMVALPLLCLVTHVLPCAIFLAGLGVMLLALHGPRFAVLLRAAPAMVLLVAGLLPLLAGDDQGGLVSRAAYDPFAARIAGFPALMADRFTDLYDTALFWAFALVWVWAMVITMRRPSGAGPACERWVATILAAGAIGAYLTAPTHLPTWQNLHYRFAALACLMLAVAVPLPPGAAPRIWRRTLAALCAAGSIYALVQFHRYDAESGDVRSLAHVVERGSCVAQIGFPRGRVMNGGLAHSGYGSYVSFWRDALPGSSFAGTRHSPLAYRRKDGSIARGAEDAALPDVGAQRSHLLRGTLDAAYGGFYRYFLLPRSRPPDEFFGPDAGRLEALGSSGPVTLYLNREGRCGG